MSTDPSPWSDGISEPDILEPTPAVIEREDKERAERDREQAASLRAWNTLAHRLAADGTIIR